MSETNSGGGTYGKRMADTFVPAGQRVVWAIGRRSANLCLVTPEAAEVDGAAATTTHALYVQKRDAFVYVELAITEERPRLHVIAHGMMGRMRFTGADDSGEWLDVVVQSAA